MAATPLHRRATRTITLRDGVTLWLSGSGAATAPVTVVLMHGWTLNSRLWHQQMPALSRQEQDIRVVAYDVRGHGRSGPAPPPAATLREIAEDLHEVLDTTGPHGTVILVGHSMGGMTIMEYAAWHPEEFGGRIGGVVLVATAADELTRGGPRWLRRVEAGTYRLMVHVGDRRPHRALTPALWVGLRRLVFGHEAPFAAVRHATSMITGSTLRTVGGFHPALAAHNRLAALGPLSRVPVAVLAGTRDRLTPPSRAERIVAELPAARHIVLRDAGHMLPLERPAEVTAAIADIVALARATGTAPGRTPPAGRDPAG